MTPAISTPPTTSGKGYLPILLLLFSASGCAALIYEVVWYQLLQLAIGSTSVSLGILLATFMGGLCIGSMWIPRLRPSGHPLQLYAKLEIGLAVTAVLVQFAIPLLSRVYMAGAEHGLPSMLLRGLLAAVCMLPPTILMGASLPAIVRWIRGNADGVAWWGYLYGGNTAGAVLGCLLAGFYLLRVYNMATATLIAAGINIAVGLISFVLAGSMPEHSSEPGAREPEAEPARTESVAGVPVHRAFGRNRAWRRSGLDAPVEHAAARHRVRVLDHPRGIPVRSGDRQRGRFLAAEEGPAAIRAGMVPDPADRRHRLDRLLHRRTASLLERRCSGRPAIPGTCTSSI